MAKPTYEPDHEKYVAKNARMARAYDLLDERSNFKSGGPRDKRVEPDSCFVCKARRTCKLFEDMRRGRVHGVDGVFSSDQKFICEYFVRETTPIKSHNAMDDREIKVLLKNAKRGNI